MKKPTTGPSNTPPIMVGTCIIVAWPAGVGTGINPIPVAPSIIEIAPSIPEITIFLVVKFI
jgi:hypothetical protein